MRQGDKVALIGAGIGITPLRALLEDLSPEVDAVMVARGHRPEDIVLRDELHTLLRAREAHLHELVGSREKVPFIDLTFARLIPDIAERDVYICGPTGFTPSVRQAALALGVSPDRIHHETFAF
jgi:ferredoxin-NADP reductase